MFGNTYPAPAPVQVGQLESFHPDATLPAEYLRTASEQTLLQSAYPELFEEIGLIFTSDIETAGDWVDNTDVGSANLDHIATDGAGTWVAIRDNGDAYTTSDPEGTWSRNASAAGSFASDGLGYLPATGDFVAFDGSQPYYSDTPDSGAWTTDGTIGFLCAGKPVLFDGKLCFPGRNTATSTFAIAYSDDPASGWTILDTGVSGIGRSVTTDGATLLLAGDSGKVFTTTDLTTITENTGSGLPGLSMQAAAYGDGIWVLAETDNLYTASDPTGSWTTYTESVAQAKGLHFHPTTGKFLWQTSSAGTVDVSDAPGVAAEVSISIGEVNDFAHDDTYLVGVGISGNIRVLRLYSYNPDTQFVVSAQGDATTAMRAKP